MHFHAKVIGKSSGQKLLSKGAYNNRTNFHSYKSGERFYHQSKEGLVHSSIQIPAKPPPWLEDIAKKGDLNRFFSLIEERETRKDSQFMRELTISLPCELSDQQNISLITEFCEKFFLSEGMIANIAIHRAKAGRDPRNIHAHVLLTMREITEKGFGNKVRNWNRLVPHWRDEWEKSANFFLVKNGFRPRIKMKSFKQRGLNKEATRYQGPAYTANKNKDRKIDILSLLREESPSENKEKDKSVRERGR